jgi:hypothetical protein
VPDWNIPKIAQRFIKSELSSKTSENKKTDKIFKKT